MRYDATNPRLQGPASSTGVPSFPSLRLQPFLPNYISAYLVAIKMHNTLENTIQTSHSGMSLCTSLISRILCLLILRIVLDLRKRSANGRHGFSMGRKELAGP